MGKKKAPQHAMYSKMKDTPWITQARQMADIGGKGVMSNYGNVNTFDEATQKSLEARNNDVYNRAFRDMGDNYTDTMNRYAAINYNQFGSLNATAPAYRTDQYRKDYQRQMDDLSYNKAMNYDNLKDKELQRRYNTLDMFNNMYGYGQTPYEQDLKNWNITNTNKDVAYNNAMANFANQGGGWQGALKGALKGAASGASMGPWGMLGGAVAGGVGGYM